VKASPGSTVMTSRFWQMPRPATRYVLVVVAQVREEMRQSHATAADTLKLSAPSATAVTWLARTASGRQKTQHFPVNHEQHSALCLPRGNEPQTSTETLKFETRKLSI
jgi:hypothetical protein